MILDRAVGSFVPDGQHHFRILSEEEFWDGIERADTERLARRGFRIDPFTVSGRFGPRTVYRIAADPEPTVDEVILAADVEAEENPFDVSDLIEPEEETVEWAEADYAQYRKSVGAGHQPYDLNASLGAADRWLAARDPFGITTRGRQGQ